MLEKILLQHGWEKVSNWKCLFVHRQKGLSLSVHVDDVKLAGKKHNIDPMWKVLNKEVDLGEPTSFLDHIYLGCTQRQCETSRYCGQFQSHVRISNFRGCELKNFHTFRIFVSLRGLMTWKVMRRNVWSDIVSWQTRRLNNFTKYLLHASMATTSKKKKWNLLENCHKYALLKCLCLARIGRPDILWSVNKLPRSITKDHSL